MSPQRLTALQTIDYRFEDREKRWLVKMQPWCHSLIGSLFQKTPIITLKKWTVQPGDAFEDTAFKPHFQILSHVAESQILTYLWNRYHQWHPGTKPIQISALFQHLISGLTPLLESELGFGNWHATRGWRNKTTMLFISIVHVSNCQPQIHFFS